MEYAYEFAGLLLKIKAEDETLYSDHGVLTPFVSVSKRDGPCLSFELSDKILPPEGKCIYEDNAVQIYRSGDALIRYAGPIGSAHMRIERRGLNSTITCLRNVYSNGITPKTVLNGLEAEHWIVQNGGFFLHASLIKAGEKAILFTAPSGTGKSTQADLWCKHRNAELINGDRAAITIEDGQVMARGIPYSSSSGVAKNKSVPVAAIVYLGQAPSNSVEKLAGFASFRKIWEGCSVNVWDQSDVDKASKTILDVINAVPVLFLKCRPDREAVEMLEKVLLERGAL